VIGAALIAGALVYHRSGQRFQEFEADKLMFVRLDTWSGLTSVCVVRGKSEGEEREGVVRCYPWSK
jgi:hypothetical protein